MKKIIDWIIKEYEKNEVKNLQIETLISIISDSLLNQKNKRKVVKVSKNIQITFFSDDVVGIYLKLFDKVKIFDNVISLKKGDYCWVKWKKNQKEVMQVQAKTNHIHLCLTPIGSSKTFNLSDPNLTIIQKIE